MAMIKLAHLLKENFQLAMKVYKDALTPEDIEFLTKLTGRDYTFKIMADLLIEDKNWDIKWKDQDWKDALAQLRNYHKNLLPIAGFSYDSKEPVMGRFGFTARAKILKIIGEWPSIARRNIRRDLAKPRNASGFESFLNKVAYLDNHLTYLNNRSPEVKDAILKKIFSSDHPSVEDAIDFVEDKPNLLRGGTAYDKEGLYALVKKYDYDLKIVYDRGNIVIVDVTGQPGIKALGCNSMWCFTYGSEYGKAGEHWDRYSHNGHVYAIVNFSEEQDSPDFIHILIKPPEMATEHEEVLYNMANEPVYSENALEAIKAVTGEPNIGQVFKWEDF